MSSNRCCNRATVAVGYSRLENIYKSAILLSIRNNDREIGT
ncbi:hypothetical protein ACFP3I_03375 [Chryseobacterium arachidis]